MQAILVKEPRPLILVLDTGVIIEVDDRPNSVDSVLVARTLEGHTTQLSGPMQYAIAIRLMRLLHKALRSGESPSIEELIVEVDGEARKSP